MDHAHIDGLKKEYERLSADGFRVLAIASGDSGARRTGFLGEREKRSGVKTNRIPG
jgi:hypothetical protein